MTELSHLGPATARRVTGGLKHTPTVILREVAGSIKNIDAKLAEIKDKEPWEF